MNQTTKQASLPMYDLPEVQQYTQAWWQGIAKHMKHQGITDVPDCLMNDLSFDALWKRPDLFLSQCCGFNMAHDHGQYLSVLMVTNWDADGCEPYHYSSHFVVHEDSPYTELEQLKNKKSVINGLDSHSGMSTLFHAVQPSSNDGHFFDTIYCSGAHANSLQFIQNKQADVAAIDCVTFALLKRYKPTALDGIRILDSSLTAPAHPYITSIHTDMDTQQRMQSALAEAFADPTLSDVREALLLKEGKFPDLSDEDSPYQVMINGFKFDPSLLKPLHSSA